MNPFASRNIAPLIAALLTAAPAIAHALVVTLDASDGPGDSSFNTGLNWDDNTAPSAGNDYFTAAFTLRTPNNDPGDYTFVGDSLTVDGGAIAFKGSGDITVNNLTLDGGTVNHSGVGGDDKAHLLGDITLTAAGGTLNVFDHSTEVRELDVQATVTGAGGLTVSVFDTDTVRVSGAMSFTGDLNKSGHGTLILEGDNSLDTDTVFFMGNADNGAVRLAHANALGKADTIDTGGSLAFTQIELVGGIDFAPTSNGTGQIDILAAGQNAGLGGHVLKNVSGDNTWRGDITIDSGGGPSIISSDADTLTLEGNLATSLTNALSARIWQLGGDGDIVVNGAVEELSTGALGLTKFGAGTLTLAGINTYTAVTNVNDTGTLLVTGSTSASTTINVNDTANLGGNGVIGGPVSVDATAFLAPGTSIGTLIANGNVDLNGTLVIQIDETDSSVNDLLDANATLDLTGSILTFDITGPLTQAVYIFAAYDTLIGTFASDNAPGDYLIDYAFSGNQIALVQLPAPAALPAGLALLAAAASRRRRRI